MRRLTNFIAPLLMLLLALTAPIEAQTAVDYARVFEAIGGEATLDLNRLAGIFRTFDDGDEPEPGEKPNAWFREYVFYKSRPGAEVGKWTVETTPGTYDMSFRVDVTTTGEWSGAGGVFQVERQRWNGGLIGYLAIYDDGRFLFKSDLNQPARKDDRRVTGKLKLVRQNRAGLLVEGDDVIAMWNGEEIARIAMGSLLIDGEQLRIHLGSEAAPSDQPKAVEGSTAGWSWADGELDLLPQRVPTFDPASAVRDLQDFATKRGRGSPSGNPGGAVAPGFKAFQLDRYVAGGPYSISLGEHWSRDLPVDAQAQLLEQYIRMHSHGPMMLRIVCGVADSCTVDDVEQHFGVGEGRGIRPLWGASYGWPAIGDAPRDRRRLHGNVTSALNGPARWEDLAGHHGLAVVLGELAVMDPVTWQDVVHQLAAMSDGERRVRDVRVWKRFESPASD